MLISTSHVQRHPQARWTLPLYVEAWSVQVATAPQQGSDGNFFEENRVMFDPVEPPDTEWLSSERLEPGTYYVVVRGYDNACFHDAGECGVVTSNVRPLVIPPYAPRYRASVRTIHPGAIRDASRNWTYRGDTVRVRLRNETATAGQRQTYRVCYTRGARLACRTRTLVGSRVDSWNLRIMPPWAGYWRGRYVRWIEFTWHVAGKRVAKHRIWVYE